VEAFTPPEVKATSRQSRPPLHTKPTAPSPGKSIKTQGDSPRKHRATSKLNQQEENTHPPENHGKGNRTDHEHINNL